MNRPQIVVANKMDMPGSQENLEAFKTKTPELDIIPISAYTRENLESLIHKTADLLDEIKRTPLYDQDTFESHVTYQYEGHEAPYTIKKGDDGVYEIGGEGLKRLFEMTDFSKEQSIKRFARQLRGLGIDRELRELGVKHGDAVRIFDVTFEFLD